MLKPIIVFVVLVTFHLLPTSAQEPTTEAEQPFGNEFPNLDSLAVGQWWIKPTPRGPNPPPTMNVPRDQVIAFALYTHDHSVLKLTTQLYPLKPDESRTVQLEVKRNGQWERIAETQVVYPGWSAHFRIDPWDSAVSVPYRVRHGDQAFFEGLIRRDPRDQEEIVVANMSCNSSRTTGLRPEIIDRIKRQNPDLLFFAGDQTYRHTEHTAGWIEFGLQFRDVIRDRPTITIPDDHDVGHPNLWGENGKQSTLSGNADGGYFYPVDYVNMVQRQQTWHLPDPADPAPVDRGITVYFTRMRVGEVDFVILEDRKFKSGPAGKIPKMGPRPDHINDPSYDPKSIDLKGLQLLGDRQHKFLQEWEEDWSGAVLKAGLSQTAFCGAVHMHGKFDERLLADLDCNGWPQSERNRALREFRRVHAVHLCGDQHLAVVVKHGIDGFSDGPYAFTSPALVNTIYGRWWHPLDEKTGPNPVQNSPLPWTGDFLDGLGNRISMMAYANPGKIADEKQRADGYGVARFNKQTRQIKFECWPRFAHDGDGDHGQFPGWPITIDVADNDGRKPVAWLPEVQFNRISNPVVQVIEETSGEVLYTRRIVGDRFQPPVFANGTYTIKAGKDRPNEAQYAGIVAMENKHASAPLMVELSPANDTVTKHTRHENWQFLKPYFNPPDALKNDFGNYPSPLKLADGSQIQTTEQWQKRRTELLAEWHSLMGQWPPLITDQTAEVLEEKRRENFRQLKIRFRWTPDESTTGYLLIPDGQGKRPAVITVYYEPETAIGEGKEQRDFGYQLARRGFVVLSIGTTEATKAQTFGLYHPSLDAAKVQPLSMLACAAANAWHLLAKREEVDANRIGIVGHSFGGKWAMFASCLFDRFACAAWSDPGIVFDESRPSVNYWEPWYLGYYPPPWRKRGMITPDNPAKGLYVELTAKRRDLHELHALMAPRPFLVSGGSEDPPIRWQALNHTRAICELLGFQERVGMTNRPNHDPNQESNEVIYRFFEYFLSP
jgi:hypothetical protein